MMLTEERTPLLDAPRRLRAVPDTTDASPRERLTGLLVLAGQGDADAYGAFYREILAAAYRVALRIVRDESLAEDVTQEAMVEAWRKAPQFDPERGSATAWALTLTRRRAIDRVRREQRHRDEVEAESARADSHSPAPEDAVVETHYREWQCARVREAMDRLSPVQREALELAYYEGHTHREVSDTLGVPLGTAKTRIRDAVSAIRRQVKEVER